MKQQQITFDDIPKVLGDIIEPIDRLEAHMQHHSATSTSGASDVVLNVKEASEFLGLAKPTKRNTP